MQAAASMQTEPSPRFGRWRTCAQAAANSSSSALTAQSRVLSRCRRMPADIIILQAAEARAMRCLANNASSP